MKFMHKILVCLILTGLGLITLVPTCSLGHAEPISKSVFKEESMSITETEVDQDVLNRELVKAVAENEPERVETLIEQGASPNAKSAEGGNILDDVLRTGNFARYRERIINHLINNGAEIHNTDNGGETLLFSAVGEGLLSTVQLLIDKGIDASARLSDDFVIESLAGASPLFYAGDLEMLKLLEKNGVGTVEERSKNGESLLHGAVLPPVDFDVLEYLLDRIDGNVKDNDGETPLHSVLSFNLATQDVPKVVEMLLENGADINALDNDGWTPMLTAATNARLDQNLLKRLIDAGANVNHMNEAGNSAIHYAAANNPEFLKFFVQNGANVNARTACAMESPLLIGARAKELETVQFLLENKADPNLTDNKGKTALNYAQESDFSDIANLLQKHGGIATDPKTISNIKAKNELDEKKSRAAKRDEGLEGALRSGSADRLAAFIAEEEAQDRPVDLHAAGLLALNHGNLETFKLLVEKGLDIHLKDDSYTMLHDAVFGDQPEIAQYLLENGANINARPNDGRSMFEIATYSSPQTLAVLESFGLQKSDEDKDNAVLSSIYAFNPKMARHFLKQDFPFDSSVVDNKNLLGKILRHENHETLQLLLEHGLDVDSEIWIYGADSSLLQYSVLIGSTLMAEFLLKAGANPNFTDSDGVSVWEQALRRGEPALARMFIAHGADLNGVFGAFDETPLHTALNTGVAELAQILVEAGADVNVVDGNVDKNSPLHEAAKRGYVETLRRMVDAGGDVHKGNKRNETPFDLALENGHRMASEYLREIEKIQSP